MRIGAYQFAVSGNREWNMDVIRKAIMCADTAGVKLLVFPECALTGYPPHDMERPSDIAFDQVEQDYEQIQAMVNEYHMHIILGTVTKEEEHYYNSMRLFSPETKPMEQQSDLLQEETVRPAGEKTLRKTVYHKRVLWGWDKEYFWPGNQSGIFVIEGMKIGVRICCEVRDAECFKELYEAQTNLNVVIFYDVSASEDIERYEMIRGCVRARAIENACYTLSVDTIRPYQTAPTILFDKSGHTLVELERNTEGLLVYDL